MYHHDQRDYHAAASEAAAKARIKMEEIIDKGRKNAEAVIDQVERQVPLDRIVRANQVTIKPIDANRFGFVGANDLVPLHENALAQVAEKSSLTGKFLKELIPLNNAKEGDLWASELAAHNMNVLFAHQNDRYLLRAVKDDNNKSEIRGFLSDRFRRLDSRPLLNAFMGACSALGAVPVDGYALDTRVRMRAVLPIVFEPVDNEVMLFGAEWGNSDFGNGGHKLSLFNIRCWCTNTAVMDEVLRQVHIGKRLDDNIVYSRQTYELDTKANASAVKDMVLDLLSPNKVNGYLEHIKIAAEEQIDHKDVLRILKGKLNKGEVEQITDLFDGSDTFNLPEGETTYRLSNAISFFAQGQKVSRDRKLDLERFAGEIISPKFKAREV